MTNIVSIEEIGEHQTYDLEVEHPDHQFYLANGVLTSNSHAVSYAMDSYWCAWLLTYYEPEWLCAYLESMSGNPDDRSKAFGEVKSLGYEIVPIDISYATSGWTILDGKRFMPSMSSCKGVGGVALEELESMRPFKDIYELLWNEDGSWRPSKFNRKALESLIKIRAFGSLDIVGEGKLFSSYKQMHHVLIENSDEIKKHSKKDPMRGRKAFEELVSSTRDMGEWTKSEFVAFSMELLGALDISVLIPESTQKKLAERGVKPIDQWDGKNVYWAAVEDVTRKKTKAKGKDYLLLKLIGASGKSEKCFLWGNSSELNIAKFSSILIELDRTEFGFSSYASKVREFG
jgi:DNA polymerase III alpha subunit